MLHLETSKIIDFAYPWVSKNLLEKRKIEKLWKQKEISIDNHGHVQKCMYIRTPQNEVIEMVVCMLFHYVVI